jgi:hypothetical protein
MIRTSATVFINRPIETVYRFVSEDFFENYPRWSPEVIRLEQTSEGPVRIGTTGWQIRRDRGVRNEASFRVSECTPLRTISFVSMTGPSFTVRYSFETAPRGTRLTFSFELKPELFMRPAQRAIQAAFDDDSRRVVDTIRSLLETSLSPGQASSPDAGEERA